MHDGIPGAIKTIIHLFVLKVQHEHSETLNVVMCSLVQSQSFLL